MAEAWRAKGGVPGLGGYRAQCLSISGFKNKFPVNAKEKQDSFRQESIYQKTIQNSYFMVRHVPKTGNQEVFTGCPGGGQSPPLPTDSSSLICCQADALRQETGRSFSGESDQPQTSTPGVCQGHGTSTALHSDSLSHKPGAASQLCRAPRSSRPPGFRKASSKNRDPAIPTQQRNL